MMRLKNLFARFRNDERGSIATEAALMFPLLLWAVLASYVYFEAFRNQSVNTKAAYTISDAMSREDRYITNSYVEAMWRLHAFLTNSNNETKLRITMVEYHAEEDRYRSVWSRDRGGVGTYGDDQWITEAALKSQLPVMPDGETVIVVQTWVTHEPVFSVGLDAFTFEDTVITRPRFAPNGICYSHNGTDSGRICPADS